ncbi:MAG: hypothetical protein LIP08_12010 [Bacteroides sp.]|nr:hypothetical protein [Bacteroides sp.]
MTVLERKAEFIKTVLTDIDENTFEELEFILDNMKSKDSKLAPCVYSQQERQQRIEEAVKSVEEGYYFTHTEVKNRYKKSV